jgi:phosphatidylserine synthase
VARTFGGLALAEFPLLAADSLARFATTLVGRLFVGLPIPHLAEDAFLLKLALHDPEGLVDVSVSDNNFHVSIPFAS